jgi:chromosome segregation protein
MFIQRLTLHGFKSFVDRISLEFGSGLTGVIGPNGCGKTNITDAIRWVLGEQKPTVLRGATMEDVIFAGSATRKPLGMAEVTLTLSNLRGVLPVDWPEVVVTRRVYRSGVSEYLLNKTPCRLRDIRDLFYDTGVGSNAYSVIERQMVDNVLTDSGGHRRFLFEEAAGVMKYKARRKEALSKLDATEGDLTRLTDIMTEVEREVRSLQYQAAKARRWVRLRDEILKLELTVSARRRTQLLASEANLTDSLAEITSRTETLSEALREHEERRVGLAAQQAAVERRLADARGALHEAERRAAETSQELGVLRERQAGRRLRLAALDPEEERLQARLAQCRVRLEEIRSTLVEVDLEGRSAHLVEAEQRLSGAEERVRTLRAELADVAQRSLGHQRAEVEARAARDRAASEIARLAVSEAQLESELTELSRAREERAARLADIDATLQRLANALEAATQRAAEAAERGVALARERAERGAAERTLAGRLAALRSRQETLDELKAAWEGYGQGVRTLFAQETRRDDGLLGVVADLIRVPVEHADRVEAALAGAVQYVVTQDTRAARAALLALQQAEQGKATLQPLDRVPVAEAPPADLLARDGVIGSALQIVECDDRYHHVVRHLLGRVIFVRDADSAERLSTEYAGGPWRFVTPEGEVWSSEGWVRGGVGGGGEGFLRRESELRELLAEIAAAEEEQAAILDALARVGEAAEEAADVERDAQREREALTSERHALLAEQSGLAGESEHIDRRLASCRSGIDQMQSERAAQETLLSSSEDILARSAEEVAHLSERRRALEEDLQAAESGHSRELETTSELRVEVVRTTEQLRAAEDEARRVAADLQETEELLTSRRRERKETEEAIASLDDAIAEATRRAEDSSTEVRRARATMGALETERDEVTRPLGELHARTEALRKKLHDASDERHKIDLALTECRLERRSLEERIAGEYGVDLANVSSLETAAERQDAAAAVEEEGEGDADDSAQEVSDEPAQRLAQLKEKFRRLGPVNELAMSEFEEKRERLDFLTRQRDDLVAARGQLLEAIAKINQTAQALFLETFAQIQDNLKVTFGTLFVGGEAELVLVGDDPLEAEIDIRARPRGKHLQSLALLSGGEKALVAIALLFAIYQVKPSPFCILDEVDAPLDDANNERFLTMLRRFSESTQFIVVTHNKQTMAACDALYGVTMQEPGVSRIVSVRFEGANGRSAAPGESAERALAEAKDATS